MASAFLMWWYFGATSKKNGWPETYNNWRSWLVLPSWRNTDPDGAKPKADHLSPNYISYVKYPTSYYSPVKRVGNFLINPDYRVSCCGGCPPHNTGYSFPKI